MFRKMLFATVVFGLVLFGIGETGATMYKPEYKLSLVIGPQTPWGQAAQKFADLVKERSGGKINIKCYFAGQLFAGMQTNEFLILRQGVADFAVGSTINWSPAVKELNLFSLPFFFPDYKHLDAVKAGEPGKKLFKIIEERGVVGLAWGENGYRELTNSKRPVRKPEDLEGLKIRVVGSPIFVDTFRAMGGNPVSINWSEALTALQQGTVDGQENPVVSIIIPYKLWEMNKHITIWHYTIDPLIFGVSKATWEGFDPKDREMIAKAAQEAAAWNLKEARKGLEGSTEAIDLLKGKGMEVVVFTAKDMEVFKAKTKSVYDKWVPEIGADLVSAADKVIKGVK
ncbi:MAG: DctP family TRAP transporter solute-binding subunit [Desulfobacterota bacterium]|nr:DctP family TRAP transporter solute-binding subunit [Thermodesulfobacteriota bacterium]